MNTLSTILSAYLIRLGFSLMLALACCSCGKHAKSDETVALTGEASADSSILMATSTRPLTNIKFEPTPQRLERGKYLTNGILMCFVCHSPRDSSQAGFPPIEAKLGGGAIIAETATSRTVAPNISPDSETGAGRWTDDMFARAIREGIGHDGRALSLPMYWESYRGLSDEDLASIVVYLRSIPPVKNKLPLRRYSPEKEQDLQGSPKPLKSPVQAVDQSDKLSRGRYLVKTANCAGCHTGWYKRNPGFFGGGNPLSRGKEAPVFSTNITPHASGLQGWTPETFTRVIRTGKAGTLHPIMPWVAYKNLTDEDLEAIFIALQQVPPVNHKVINSMAATYCKVCGQEHGYGEYNKIEAPKAVTFNKSLYPDFVGTYLHPEGFSAEVKLEGGKLLISEGGEFMELIPVAGNRFEALGLSTPVSFKRDESGKVMWMISYWIEEDLFVKQSSKVSSLSK
jgi:mono/diheme cytochrome c family protein